MSKRSQPLIVAAWTVHRSPPTSVSPPLSPPLPPPASAPLPPLSLPHSRLPHPLLSIALALLSRPAALHGSRARGDSDNTCRPHACTAPNGQRHIDDVTCVARDRGGNTVCKRLVDADTRPCLPPSPPRSLGPSLPLSVSLPPLSLSLSLSLSLLRFWSLLLSSRLSSLRKVCGATARERAGGPHCSSPGPESASWGNV